jgi:16S rRNA G1207 methylase RsmC
MAKKTLIDTVVKQLQQERARLENELHRVSAALTTFGSVLVHGNKRASAATGKKRTISAAGRKRIAAAQRARWARVRAAKK